MFETRISTSCKVIVGLPLLVVGLGAPGAAEEGLEEPEGTFNVLVENDKFAGTDRHYTNGLQFSYLSPRDTVPSFLKAFAAVLPGIPEGSALRAGYVLGHNIYTPDDTAAREPLPDQRPYAGWLYGGLAVLGETEDTLSTWELDVGVVGSSAQGEEVQNAFHDLLGADDANGWDNELDDEPGVALIYERKWRNLAEFRESGFGIDLTPHLGGSLGNVGTYLNTGITLRFGKDLSNDFGPPRIRPSLPGSGFFVPRNTFGWYLFAGVDGRAIAYNIFLDGNADGDSLSVDKEPLVADIQVGGVVTIGWLHLAYTHVYRTQEFEEQDRGDRFGAISLSAKF
jgi:lipid A 3-O-deacylase